MPTISVELSRQYMNVDHSADDDIIRLFIGAADEWFQHYTGVKLVSFDTVPAGIQRAILMLVAHYYENREAFSADRLMRIVPGGVISIAENYRVSHFGVPVEEVEDDF